MAIRDYYKCDDKNNNKVDKVEGGVEVYHTPTPRHLAQNGTLYSWVTRCTKLPLSTDMFHGIDKPTLLVLSPQGIAYVVVGYKYYYDPKGVAVWQDQDYVSGHIMDNVLLGGCGHEGVILRLGKKQILSARISVLVVIIIRGGWGRIYK